MVNPFYNEDDWNALAQNFNSTPNYQAVNFTPDFSVFNDMDNYGQQGFELQSLLERKKALAGLSPQEQAASNYAPWSNADQVRMTNLINFLPNHIRREMQDVQRQNLTATANAYLENPGASGYDKSVGAAILGNKTFANVLANDPNSNFSLPMGNQLYNSLNRFSHRGVNLGQNLSNYANLRDMLMDQNEPYGGYQVIDMGYNSMGMGGGEGPVVGGQDNPTGKGLWGDLGQASGMSYDRPYLMGDSSRNPAPPPNPFRNNTGGPLTGSSGVQGYIPDASIPKSPFGGTGWSPMGPQGSSEAGSFGNGPGGLDDLARLQAGGGRGNPSNPMTPDYLNRNWSMPPNWSSPDGYVPEGGVRNREITSGEGSDFWNPGSTPYSSQKNAVNDSEFMNFSNTGSGAGTFNQGIQLGFEGRLPTFNTGAPGSNVAMGGSDIFNVGGGNWGSPNMVSSPGAFGTYGPGYGVFMPSNPLGAGIVNALYGITGGF